MYFYRPARTAAVSARITARVIAAVILIALPLTLLEKYSAAGCRTFASSRQSNPKIRLLPNAMRP